MNVHIDKKANRREENPKTDTCVCGHLTYGKSTNGIQWGRNGTIGYLNGKK